MVLSKLIDKSDNLKLGKCCKNLDNLNFARKNKNSRKSTESKNSAVMDLLKANFCLDIFIPNTSKWRLCSDKASHISKLQLQIEYNILLSNTGKKNTSIISIVIN